MRIISFISELVQVDCLNEAIVPATLSIRESCSSTFNVRDWRSCSRLRRILKYCCKIESTEVNLEAISSLLWDERNVKRVGFEISSNTIPLERNSLILDSSSQSDTTGGII